MFFAVFLFSELKISPDATFFAILLLGLTAGLLHAIEADHIAAVTTIVTERKKLFSAALVGGFWGIGHTITLLFFGLLAILLKMQIGPKNRIFTGNGCRGDVSNSRIKCVTQNIF